MAIFATPPPPHHNKQGVEGAAAHPRCATFAQPFSNQDLKPTMCGRWLTIYGLVNIKSAPFLC